MGPSIIFDKSAIQSLGQQSIYEVNRYFHTVFPPVLLHEILADLSLIASDLVRFLPAAFQRLAAG